MNISNATSATAARWPLLRTDRTLRALALTALWAGAVSPTVALAAEDEGGSPAKHRAGIVLEEFVYTEAPFPQCHASTILELEGGALLCAFFGGTRERHPDVGIRVCRKPAGGGWTTPVEVANGVESPEHREPTWNPVLFQPRDTNDVLLFYKVGPSPSTWWGMVTASTDGGESWTEPRRLRDGILGPIKNKPIQLADGTIVAGSSTEGGGWRAHVELSDDGGKTWRKAGPIDDPATFGVIQPTFLTHAGGRLQMLLRSRRERGVIPTSWSSDDGRTWSALSATTLPNNNSGLDAVTLEDGRHLLVYNHSTRNQEGRGHKGRGVLNVAVSEDGKRWRAALVLDFIARPNHQFSYPAVIQGKDGRVHITYTWHRKRIKHVVLDPEKLVTFPIVDGEWPAEKIPLVPSTDPIRE